MVEQARALKKATEKPTKIQYTGIQVLAQCTNDLHYDNPRDRAMAMAAAINEDILEVGRDGRRLHPARRVHLALLLRGLGDRGVQPRRRGRAERAGHRARLLGQLGRYAGLLPGRDGGVGRDLRPHQAQAARRRRPPRRSSRSPTRRTFDVLNLENCGRRSDDLSGLDVLKNHPLPDNVTFWAGVIDVKSTITETAEEVCDRIRRLAEYVPPERLGVTTDCGLILLQRYIAIDKLHALSAGTEMARQKLGL